VRPQVLDEVRDQIWRYVSPAVAPEAAAVDAAALLGLGETDALTIGRILFLLSDEVGLFLSDIPELLRRLPTSS
jgi:hypothetical protein